MCEWIGVEGWMRPLGTWEGAAATDGRARDGFPQPSPSSPSSTIFLSPYLTPPSAHPLSFSPPYTPHISLALSMVNQVVHQIGKLEMDSLTQAHFAFSSLYSSHSLPLPHPASLILMGLRYPIWFNSMFEFCQKMIHSIFDSITLYPRFNSKYYSIQKKFCWFNSKDNSIQ